MWTYGRMDACGRASCSSTLTWKKQPFWWLFWKSSCLAEGSASSALSDETRAIAVICRYILAPSTTNDLTRRTISSSLYNGLASRTRPRRGAVLAVGWPRGGAVHEDGQYVEFTLAERYELVGNGVQTECNYVNLGINSHFIV